MALLGLSILVASFSYICYRHPPATWHWATWIQRVSASLGFATADDSRLPETRAKDKTAADAPEIVVHLDEKDHNTVEDGLQQAEVTTSTSTAQISPRNRDQSMPPPPIPRLHISSKAPVSPSQSHDTSSGLPAPPAFPAANSAQRASGGQIPQIRTLVSPGSIPQPPLRSIQDVGTSPRVSSLSSSSSNASKLSGLIPPPRGPLPNRGPGSLGVPSNSSLSAPSTSSRSSKKILLSPGHSPLDWAAYLASAPAHILSGLPAGTSFIRVSLSQLAWHNGRMDKATGKRRDAWTALGAKVYNISPYLEYHPGGQPELLRCAGRDGTRLFNEIHPWVSWEGMLEPGCLVGLLVKDDDAGRKTKPEVTANQSNHWDEMD